MQLEKACSDPERVVGSVVGKDHDEKFIRTIVDEATPETDNESTMHDQIAACHDAETVGGGSVQTFFRPVVRADRNRWLHHAFDGRFG